MLTEPTQKRLDLTTRGKCIYWLTLEPDDAHQAIVAELNERGFDVQFFRTLDALTKELRIKRVTFVVVGDEGPEVIVLKAISMLNRMPDIQGAKLVLSCSRYSRTVLRAAACEGFRDILPLTLPAKSWGQRFLFSVGESQEPLPMPNTSLACNSESSFSIPARVVWISEQEVWIESRIYPNKGTKFALTGPVAQSMGVKAIDLEVIASERKNLHYRFSIALICKYRHPENDELVQETLNAARQLDTGPRVKTFLVIQSPALRASVIRHLTDEVFDIRAALQKKSLTEEPRYFSPDLVIIEDRLCIGTNQPRFGEMLKSLPRATKIVILGDSVMLNQIQTLAGDRKLYNIKRIPVNLREQVVKDILNLNIHTADASKWFIPAEHEFSLAEIKFPALLKRLHPDLAVMAVPHPVGIYGLARIESSLLKAITTRFPYSKISASYSGPNLDKDRFPYMMECYFCDIPLNERKTLGRALEKMFSQELAGIALDDQTLIQEVLAEEQQRQQPQPDPAIHPESLDDILTIQERTRARRQENFYSDMEAVKSSTRLSLFAIIVTFMILAGALIGFKLLAPSWEKSGKSYSDSLEKFKNR